MATPKPPTGCSRFFWRFPILLFHLRLDWMFGNKILLLRHIGRKSGKERTAALEVVRYEKEQNIYYVCSGFGKRANWYRNLIVQPEVEIRVAGRDQKVRAIILSPAESGDEMVKYALKHPKLAKNLMKIIGHPPPQSEEEFRILAFQHLPFVAFENIDCN